jgi:type IV secretion system protein VirB10
MSVPKPPLDSTSGHDPRPVVRLPHQGMPGIAIGLGAIVLALVLFFVLNGRREQRATAPRAVAQDDGFAPPPALSLPIIPEPIVPTPKTVVVTTAAPAIPPVLNNQPFSSPYNPPVIVPLQQVPLPLSPAPAASGSNDQKVPSAMVFDLGVGPANLGVGESAAPAVNPTRGGGPGGSSGLEDGTAKATMMRSRTDVVPIGTLVPIALETPIDTARPGLVRAIASRDTCGFDGRRVLIPRGSRFIGEYQADVRSGQNRVLVTWTQVIRPDGVTIRLGSPAADQLGGSGIPGKVNSFFFQRFAGAVLQSALTVGVNLASRPRSGSVVVGIPSGPISSIGQGLVSSEYRPKITVKQGEALNVFVARDLDFSGQAAGQR